jgi:hypothetical protein
MRRFKLHDLKEKCRALEDVVRGAGIASTDELDAHRPGGEENGDKGQWGWIHWHAQLVRINAEAYRSTSFRGADPEQTILAALRREPLAVELVLKDAPGAPNPLYIHPKGIDALMWFHEKDQTLTALGALHNALERNPSPEDVAGRLGDVMQEITYQHRLLTWCASHPEPWLPFDRFKTAAPNVPKWTEALDAYDLLRVVQRVRTVNGGRLEALKGMITFDSPGDRPMSWSVFGASIARDENTSTPKVLRNRSLEELVATVALDANQKREAAERARRERSRGDDD